MEACFDDMLSGQGEGRRVALVRLALNRFVAQHREGVWAKDATLWGGNLSVLVSLLGTPYFPQIKGGVLFLEDISEHPDRIERMLTPVVACGRFGSAKSRSCSGNSPNTN
jgi:muramoyltetrapeptide carboxypeptidase